MTVVDPPLYSLGYLYSNIGHLQLGTSLFKYWTFTAWDISIQILDIYSLGHLYSNIGHLQLGTSLFKYLTFTAEVVIY